MTDERSFLAALHADPHNDLLRQVYADWLDDHDRPGADFLRLECEVFAEDKRKHPRKNKKRKGWELPYEFLEAAQGLNSAWLAEVSRVPIEICGKSMFRFVCQKKWEELTVLPDQTTTRHCEECKENVHFCDSKEQAMSHATLGHCVALSLPMVALRGKLPVPRRDHIVLGNFDISVREREIWNDTADAILRRQQSEEHRKFS